MAAPVPRGAHARAPSRRRSQVIGNEGGPLVRATVLDALAGRSDSNSRRALQFWNARGAGSGSLEDAVYAPVDGD